ncbi:uncharacterized protein [Manis javanica]|uniref:uncharacterized protein isoform X2 n=1 Tax=Manis javanica TaxID=9974 RepID=UPI003C6CE4F9
MRSCCVKPSEGVGVREAQRECPLAACGRWLRDHLQRLCPCLLRSPEREPEPTLHGTEVPTCRAPWTGVRRKGRKHSVRVEPAPNTSRSASEATLPPEDADQLAAVKKQGEFWARTLSSGTTLSRNISWSLLSLRSWSGSDTSDALTASSSNTGHDEGPEEELKMPYPSRRKGRARHVAWQDEHLGPTVSELEDPRHRQLAPETKGRPASWLQLVQALLQTPVQELRPVSPASAPAELEDIQAEASAPRQGPELEPHEPSGLGRRATAIMVPGLAEPEPCPDPMSPGDIPGVVSAPVPGPELEPHKPSGPGPVAPAGMAPGLAEPEADPEPTSTCVTITRDVPRTEEWTILQFPAHLVAEQLTLMCAELYSRIQYGECKAYLESPPLMEGTELLGPNVQMVIRQFNAMVSLVISSCLGTVTMTAQNRAQVVQFWIRVAEECLALKNFAALRAILLALQSRPIGRLESTWGRVSWKSSRTYKKLKKRNEEANREWLLEEARALMKQKLCAPRGCQPRKKQVPQGMVPFLGSFLRDVPVDQLPENNYGDGKRQRQLSAQSQKVRDGVKTPWAGPCLTHPLGLTCLERVKTHRAEDTKGFVRWGVASRPPSWRRSWRPNSGNRQGWMALEGRRVPM